MRGIALLLTMSASVRAALASPLEDDFARRLEGPWGRVDLNWQSYVGALSKNSCPPLGVRQPSTIGLFGEGGAMWIEVVAGGALKWHEGALVRTLTLARAETPSSAVYSELGVERRLTLVGANQLRDVRLPEAVGVPPTQYSRCKIKKG